MNTSGDAAEQIVRFSLEGVEVGARLSGKAAKEIARLLVAVLSQKNKTKGRARLTNMIRSGKSLHVFSVPNRDLSTFCYQAKRYGVLYCVLKDKSDPTNPTTDLLVRAEDGPKVNRILTRYHLQYTEQAKLHGRAAEQEGPETPIPAGADRSRPSTTRSDPAPSRADPSAPAPKPSVRRELHRIRTDIARRKTAAPAGPELDPKRKTR